MRVTNSDAYLKKNTHLVTINNKNNTNSVMYFKTDASTIQNIGIRYNALFPAHARYEIAGKYACAGPHTDGSPLRV